MADTLNLCVTDSNGFGLFDYRFLNRIGNGENVWVSSVMDMINNVQYIANSRGVKIANLYINGHGAPGWQAVGAGTGSDDSGQYSLQVDEYGQLKGVAASCILPTISSYLTDDAMVTLSGCNVACEADGKALLRAMAAALGVWVQAADATQYAWIPGWEGHVWKASPSGDIKCPDGDYM
jgi:hypothetical protein